MSDKEYDEIHDYDYNQGFEGTDLTQKQESYDSNDNTSSQQEIAPVINNRRSMFSQQGEGGNNSNVFDNATTMNMIQGNTNVVNRVSYEELKSQQNLPLGVIGGVIASVFCILLWSLITVLTKFQITYMAIGVGFAVGFSIQKWGKGITPIYGVLGAILALITCFIGNFVSSVCLIADDVHYSYSEAFSSLDMDTAIMIAKETFQPIDLLFYGIAIYTGYICSIKSASN